MTSRRVARLVLAAAIAYPGLGVACSPEPECPPPPSCPAVEPAPLVCPSVAEFDTRTVADPASRLALDTAKNLFAEAFAPVRALLTEELAAELSDAKLAAIVRGLVQAHGPPAQLVDAWTSEIREKEERMPAAQVLIRMANGARINLLLVFDRTGAVKGLWLRPI